jgi:predicted transposase/invertase (TIGR01784 family)
VTYYLLEAGNADDPDELVERMARRLPEHEEEMMNAAEQLRQRGWQEGWQKGRLDGWEKGQLEGWQKGSQEGRQEERLELARRLLLRGRPVEEIEEDTGLSEEEIRRLRPERTLH